MSDRDIVFVECKVTGQRNKRAYFMRRSEAQIDRQLTNSMKDAKREIARAFSLIAGHMGYVTSRQDDVPRGESVISEQWLKEQTKKLRLWMKACPDKFKGITLDIVVFGFGAGEIAEQRAMDTKDVTACLREGLNFYCINQGWGDQLKSDMHD